jgi:uroporphyrinogen decarboxylase
MSATAPNSNRLREFQLAALAIEHSEPLQQAIKRLGGKLVMCQAYSTEDLQEGAQLARKVASQFANQLLVGEFDLLVFVTAAGAQYFFQQSARLVDRQRLIDSLTDIRTVAGSPSATLALESLGISPTIALQQPQSWRDVLVALDQKVRVANFNVGLEESESIHGLGSGIEARGGRVSAFSVYPHVPPSDPQAGIDFLNRLQSAECQAILFVSPAEVQRFCSMTRKLGWNRWLKRFSDEILVFSLGKETTELLVDRQISVDYTSQASDIEQFVHEIAEVIGEIENQKQIVRANFSGPATSGINRSAPWYDSPFMKACRGEPTQVTPIWLMQQAGRYLPEYRDLRSKMGYQELCSNPQLCSEVMCAAVRRLGVDAAIVFSDLLSMLVPMGVSLDFDQAKGPRIRNPIREPRDVNRVRRLENNDEVMFVLEAVTQTRRDLPDDLPLIGFAGAPFTLACYMIEGGPSRSLAHAKRLMLSDVVAWQELMQHLAHSISIYLNGQIAAGAQAVQLFDPWAGCLGFEDYKKFVLPYVQQVINRLPRHVPAINFATGNPSLLPLLADTRASVIGIDWRIRLDQAWDTIGHHRSIQGNLDPVVLLTDPHEIRRQTKLLLDQAAARPGHIFNLGHGILSRTPVDNVIALVDSVHELSQAGK